MASHVVVLDTSARRATVKTNPGTFLIDVIREACQKLGHDDAIYGLKNNNKNLDLSRTIRLSGLSTGAKLELVLRSRSPSVVSVALQLPEPDAGGSSRLTDKFPSTTTLWLILRKFESAQGSKRNFTARGVPQLQAQASGAGRLVFETPVIQVLGRELSSFSDLQKTLAQLGINSGSALLRLTFKNTDTPLEEAMAEIGQYVNEVEGNGPQEVHASDLAVTITSHAPVGTALSPEATDEPLLPKAPSFVSGRSPSQAISTTEQSSIELSNEKDGSSEAIISAGDLVTGPSQRTISVFAPSSSSTPKAAQQPFNERDYEPTTDHAKLHQSRLSATGANKRLPSDAELAAEATSQAKKMADVTEVEIKIRFPDQMQVISTFSNLDTASTLYESVREMMEREDEPFSLRFSTAAGPKTVPKGSDNSSRLIGGLGMSGRVLVNVVWDDGTSTKAREGNVLKKQYTEIAREIEVKQLDPFPVEESGETPITKGKSKDETGRKTGTPRWLKLPGKR